MCRHLAAAQPWGNCRRDLAEACVRASRKALAAHLKAEALDWDALPPNQQQALKAEYEVGPVTPNDLRRTYATWLRQHGVEPHLIGVALGHRDSRMTERVYGRVPVDSLGERLAERVGDCSAYVANTRGAERSVRQMGRSDRSKTPAKTVPRDRIELPTRGFSILCSTD
jgi:hypothetical protein